MSFLKTHCSLSPVFEPKDLEGFHCGDHDIDEFFTNDCFGFTTQLLGKTYCYRLNEEPNKVVVRLLSLMQVSGSAICLMHVKKR